MLAMVKVTVKVNFKVVRMRTVTVLNTGTRLVMVKIMIIVMKKL